MQTLGVQNAESIKYIIIEVHLYQNMRYYKNTFSRFSRSIVFNECFALHKYNKTNSIL